MEKEMLELKYWLNILSPFLGLSGTVLWFFFGLPPQINPKGQGALLIEQEDAGEKTKAKGYIRASYLGLLLIAISFLLQFITGWIR